MSEQTITLSSGESKTVLLTVNTTKMGANMFMVKALGTNNNNAKATGILMVVRKPNPSQNHNPKWNR
ncbi:MAG: hypothetical protein Q7S74_04640 [Nanoarchaeota archaeon]|nr:hypothetical protein [Nanoarchaeota archaeon]